MCLPSTKDREMNTRDIALAFMNLIGIRKFEQVVTSMLSVTKRKESQVTIVVLVSKSFLLKWNSVMVWNEKGGKKSDYPKMTHYPHVGWLLPENMLEIGGVRGEKNSWKKNREEIGGGEQKTLVRPYLFGQFWGNQPGISMAPSLSAFWLRQIVLSWLFR